MSNNAKSVHHKSQTLKVRLPAGVSLSFVAATSDSTGLAVQPIPASKATAYEAWLWQAHRDEYYKPLWLERHRQMSAVPSQGWSILHCGCGRLTQQQACGSAPSTQLCTHLTQCGESRANCGLCSAVHTGQFDQQLCTHLMQHGESQAICAVCNASPHRSKLT